MNYNIYDFNSGEYMGISALSLNSAVNLSLKDEIEARGTIQCSANPSSGFSKFSFKKCNSWKGQTEGFGMVL